MGEILNKQEKEYLSNIIKPFKNTVRAIAKYDDIDYDNYSFILIIVKQLIDGYDIINEGICLPIFKSDIMYKGMKVGKQYTLDELEL